MKLENFLGIRLNSLRKIIEHYNKEKKRNANEGDCDQVQMSAERVMLVYTS
jgi:hypothetical protein